MYIPPPLVSVKPLRQRGYTVSSKKWPAIVALCVWACASRSFAQTPEDIDREEQLARETLRGLTGVAVLVEDIAPDAERDGLSRNQLQADVERTLRQAGIHVLSDEERLHTPGNPTLSVRVGTYKAGALYGLCIEASFKQTVTLKRNPHIERPAETWKTQGVGIGGAFHLQEVRKGVIIKVGEFINAYLAVNPKARPATIRPFLQRERRLDVKREL